MKFLEQPVYFCTGARNFELLNLFKGKLHFEYDERMASFKALGLTKALNAPVVICTTSGTAVAECVPAMLEAFYSRAPLILISGDRPKKLHGTGSPQTIDHEALTRSCRHSYLEVTLEELKHLDLHGCSGPIHINVLIDDTTPHSLPTKHHQDLSSFTTFLHGKRSPLFLFTHEEKSMRPLVEKFSQLGLPFYAETLSGARELSSIKNERDLIQNFQRGIFDSVVRIGHTPLSKVWRLLEKKQLPVFSFDKRNLPGLSYGEVLPLSGDELLQNEQWLSTLSQLKSFEALCDNDSLPRLTQKYPLSEVATLQKLQDLLSADSTVYLGNSLVVRFFELTQTKSFEVYGNRGVNGIDGQLATAIGLAHGKKTPLYCILGDYTTLYDLSAIREMPANLKLIIMNNGGGRIFDLLALDKRIVMEHDQGFADICQGFGVSYSQNLEDIKDVQVLELRPCRQQSEAFLKEWSQ